jgi:hypothetical protein
MRGADDVSPLEVKVTFPQDAPGTGVSSAAAAGSDATDGGAAPAGGDVGAVAPSTPADTDEAAADGGAAPAADALPPSDGGADIGALTAGGFTDGGPAPEPPTDGAGPRGEGVS